MKQKKYADRRRRATKKEVKIGEKVLLEQQKTTVHPPFDPDPFVVTEVRGTRVEATRKTDGKVRVRNLAKWKILKPRPEHLRLRRPKKDNKVQEDDSDDEDYIEVGLGEEQEYPEYQEPPLREQDPQPIHNHAGTTPANRPVRGRKPIIRLGIDPEAGPSHPGQLSPKERKKRQGLARRRDRDQARNGHWQRGDGGWFLWRRAEQN